MSPDRSLGGNLAGSEACGSIEWRTRRKVEDLGLGVGCVRWLGEAAQATSTVKTSLILRKGTLGEMGDARVTCLWSL